MKILPKPSGPYTVGSVDCEITDTGRTSHLASRETGRKIFVKFWYPAGVPAVHDYRRERLWEQLRGEPHLPAIAKLLLRPAMKVMTNTYHGAPYAAHAGPPRILVYNHGLISFVSENSMLMEHLASRGYIVIALQHREQLAELQALQKGQSADVKQAQATLQRRIKASTGAERAALSHEYFRIASNTNRIADARAIDVEYAVANLGSVLEAIPGVDRSAPAVVAGVIGLSLGGAVATEYARRNPAGDVCIVNMDGGIYGLQLEQPIATRYLMLYSEENNGNNARSLTATPGAAITNSVIPGTRHLNLHDIAAVYPALKWLGAIGSAHPATVIEKRNLLVSDFI